MQNRRIVLVEGYLDAIELSSHGIPAVAVCGTALSAEQARKLKSVADSVVIAFDSDEAGQKATERAIPLLLEAGLSINVLKWPKTELVIYKKG